MTLKNQTDKGAERSTLPLTARESEIVSLLALGMSNTAIGEELGIAIKTVQNHMNSILTKVAPPPWADPRVYLSLWHRGDKKRLRELAADPASQSQSQSQRKTGLPRKTSRRKVLSTG